MLRTALENTDVANRAREHECCKTLRTAAVYVNASRCRRPHTQLNNHLRSSGSTCRFKDFEDLKDFKDFKDFRGTPPSTQLST
jgi:hypothetical protein